MNEAMNETTVQIIIAVITALGSVIVAGLGWAAKKGVNYVDAKTKYLDGAHNAQKKHEIKTRIVDMVTLIAKGTMQTYVNAVKEMNADGKLTKEEARIAFDMTCKTATSILSEEGLSISQALLAIIIEAVVGDLKPVKNSLREES